MRLRNCLTVISSVLNFIIGWRRNDLLTQKAGDLDMSSTEDKINAYDAVASSYQAGIQPAIFLTHSFLQDHPILLEEGYLTVNWDRIPGLYTWTDKLLMVSITDAQWEKWGRPGGWTAWESDTRAGNFIPNMAVVVCKGTYFTMLRTPSCRTRLAIL